MHSNKPMNKPPAPHPTIHQDQRQPAAAHAEGRRWLLPRTQVAAPVHGVGICNVSRCARAVRRRGMPRHVTLAVYGLPHGHVEVVVRAVSGRDVERWACASVCVVRMVYPCDTKLKTRTRRPSGRARRRRKSWSYPIRPVREKG